MQSNTIIPKRGLQLDGLDVERTQDRLTFALNAVLDTDQGEGPNYSFEPGMSIATVLPEGYQVIGHVNLERNEQALFLTNGTTGQIGVFNGDTYEVSAQSDDFPFSLDNPITGLYQLREGCQRVIFFQDKATFDFYYNLDRPEDFKTNGSFDMRKFRLQKEISSPCITAQVVNAGNAVRGQYRFILGMLDADFNVIGYSHASAPIYIHDPSTIEVNASQLSDEVSFIRYYVVEYTRDSGVPAVFRFAEEPVYELSSSAIFDGRTEEFISEELAKFLLRPIIYESSMDMQFVDNRLVRFAPKEIDVDYSQFQRSASKIKSYYKMLPQSVSQRNKDVLRRESFPTFVGDEIYSVGIVYQFRGFESPVFHIPGPSKDQINCTPVGNTGEQLYTTCLKVKVIGAIPPESGCSVNYSITYTINGGDLLTVSGSVTPEEEEVIECLEGPQTITIVEFTQATVGSGCGDMEAEAFVVVDEVINDPGDTDLLTTWSVDLEFLGIESQAQLDAMGGVPRWKVYNTAKKIGPYHGRPGYYEGTSTYQNPFSCADGYWGVDACGHALEGMPIRHHRMPDRTMEPTYRNGQVWRIGMDFDNVEYPHPDIIGHYFVFRKRTEKTVLDKGVLVPMMQGEHGNIFTYLEHDNQSNNYQTFFSPLTNKGKKIEGGTYYKLENRVYESSRRFYEENYNATISGKNFYIGARVMYYDNYQDPLYTNLSIREERMLQPGELKRNLLGEDVSNLSMNNFALASRISSSIGGIQMASLKTWRPNMYSNLFGGEYYRMHGCMKTLDSSQECFDGDGFVTHFRMVNTVIRKVKKGIWDDILIIGAVVLSVAITVVTAGAAAAPVGAGLSALIAAGVSSAAGIGAIIAGALTISTSIIKATVDLIERGDFDGDYLSKDDDDFEPSGEVGSAYQYYASEILENVFVESDTNYAIARKEFEYEAGNILEEDISVEAEVISYLYQKIAYYDKEEEKHLPKVIIVPEIYEYSLDFAFRSQAMRAYFPLPITTDFCSSCAHTHPNWIVWSNVAVTDSVSDAMRIFLSENYIAIGSNTGAITAGYYDGKGLWVRTRQSMFRLSPNPQVVRTDASEAYLGTGSFLGVPSDQINPVNYGYGGGQGRHDHVQTEYGWVTVDANAGRVFMISDGIQEVSQGVEMWMRRNLGLNLKEDSTLNGTGIILFYDPFFHRVLIHKRDFRFIGDNEALRFDREQYEDLSFTIGISLKYREWLSLHSYMPAWAWNDDKQQFFVERDNKIWKTDRKNHGFYFGKHYPFVIELSHVSPANYILDVVDYQAQVQEYDAINDQWVEKHEESFDKVWIYNQWASTRLLDLDYNEDPWTPVYDSQSVQLERSSEHYRLSGFFDIATGQPIATSSWQAKLPFYGDHGYIDKVPNEDNLNIDGTQWELNDLSGKFHSIRFFYSNPIGKKIVFNMANTILTLKTV